MDTSPTTCNSTYQTSGRPWRWSGPDLPSKNGIASRGDVRGRRTGAQAEWCEVRPRKCAGAGTFAAPGEGESRPPFKDGEEFLGVLSVPVRVVRRADFVRHRCHGLRLAPTIVFRQ